MSDLKFELGVPKHGWFPFELVVNGIKIENSGSHVWNDPAKDLIKALWEIIEGKAAKVDWYLEPSAYIFDFKPNNENTILTIYFTEDYDLDTQHEFVLSQEMDTHHLLKTFWLGVEKLMSHKVGKNDWYDLNYKGMAEMKQKINELK